MITRVRVTEPFSTYYEGVPQSFAAGDVLEGPIADFLYVGGSAVEPIGEEDDPPAQADGTKEPRPAGGGGDIVPDGSAKDVLDWVGSDPDRARAAETAERAKDKPRSTLLADLGKITAG